MTIWDAKTGKIAKAFEWKATAKDGAKSIKFDADEKYFAR